MNNLLTIIDTCIRIKQEPNPYGVEDVALDFLNILSKKHKDKKVPDIKNANFRKIQERKLLVNTILNVMMFDTTWQGDGYKPIQTEFTSKYDLSHGDVSVSAQVKDEYILYMANILRTRYIDFWLKVYNKDKSIQKWGEYDDLWSIVQSVNPNILTNTDYQDVVTTYFVTDDVFNVRYVWWLSDKPRQPMESFLLRYGYTLLDVELDEYGEDENLKESAYAIHEKFCDNIPRIPLPHDLICTDVDESVLSYYLYHIKRPHPSIATISRWYTSDTHFVYGNVISKLHDPKYVLHNVIKPKLITQPITIKPV